MKHPVRQAGLCRRLRSMPSSQVRKRGKMDKIEYFYDGEITVKLRTPLTAQEYQRLGVELVDWLLEHRLIGELDNPMTGEKLEVQS